MTALLVVLMFVGFVLLDVVVRAAGRRLVEARERRDREAVLQTSLRLDFTHEARSLKRVEVEAPRARILAVDDEPVVLDSFRKILVLAGYSVDTVESGPEALGLVQRHDYDFVFTDLKMPGMHGVDVVKGVKHLRPDVDVAVITGYATIESAVETMKHGAMDYVQKPFTEDELTEFTRRLLVKRQARLLAARRPPVRIAAPAAAESAGPHEYVVPGGAFLAEGHTWARIEPDGHVRAGLDDFARRALGTADAVRLPQPGALAKQGEGLFEVTRGGRTLHFPAPVGGRVVRVNGALAHDPGALVRSPYEDGWVCILEPQDLASELKALRIGLPVAAWYQEEIERLHRAGEGGPVDDLAAFEERFLRAGALVR